MVSNATNFQEACGAAGPLRLAVGLPGSAGAVCRDFPTAFVLIGRDPACTLCLDHAAVGDRHAYLQVVASRVFCVDLHSRSGTHWEDGSEGSGWLHPGLSVRIGPFRIRLAVDGPGALQPPVADPGLSPLRTLPREEDRLPGLVLDFLEGGAGPVQWRMRQTLVLLGKSARCKIQMGGPGVLRFHAGLLRTPQGPWLVDFGGGTRVNGAAVHLGRLADGDLVQVGRFCMRVRYEASRASTTAQVPQLAAPAAASVRALPPPAGTGPSGTGSGPHRWSTSLVATSAATAATPPGGSGWSLPALTAAVPPDLADWSPSALVQQVHHLSVMQQQMAAQHQQTMTMMCQFLGMLLKDHRGAIRDELERLQQVTQELQAVQSQLVGKERGEPAARPVPKAPAPQEAATDPGPANGAAEADRPSEDDPPRAQPHSWLVERMASLQDEQQTLWQRLMKSVRGTLLGAEE